MARARTGKCSMCGQDGKLSFEHVPPKAAFNDRKVFEADVRSLFSGSEALFVDPKGKWNQRGAGIHPSRQLVSLKVAREELNKAIALMEQTRWTR